VANVIFCFKASSSCSSVTRAPPGWRIAFSSSAWRANNLSRSFSDLILASSLAAALSQCDPIPGIGRDPSSVKRIVGALSGSADEP
jgi:hypothetical protein